MQVLDAEKWRQKLNDAKRTGKLNISYFDLPEITAAQVDDIRVRTHAHGPTRDHVRFGPATLQKRGSRLTPDAMQAPAWLRTCWAVG
jgi:hypothetical protein